MSTSLGAGDPTPMRPLHVASRYRLYRRAAKTYLFGGFSLLGLAAVAEFGLASTRFHRGALGLLITGLAEVGIGAFRFIQSRGEPRIEAQSPAA